MEKYNLSLGDVNTNFFHFTLRPNLKSIEENGLVPQKGAHAKYIETTNKVFFVQGLDNLLILFDCWINVYKMKPILPDWKISLGLGSKALRSKHFPMFLVDFYFWLIKNSKRHKKNAYQIFDKLLETCILLHLDIQENNDFSFSDIDEIKSSGYRRKDLIRLGYSLKYSDMDSNKMDLWNLHTMSDKRIEPEKIELCIQGSSDCIQDILYSALKNTKMDLKDICPVLYDYLDSRKLLGENTL